MTTQTTMLDQATEVEEWRKTFDYRLRKYGPHAWETQEACAVWTDLQSVDGLYSAATQDRLIRDIYAKYAL